VQDRFLRAHFGEFRVEATVDNPDATTAKKSGAIASGLRDLLAPATSFAGVVEFGTASDEEQLAATYQGQWVYRRGSRSVPAHREAVWNHRCCFTPADPVWERAALAHGERVLDRARAGVTDLTRG
jgi:hypothetical protein